MHIYLTRSLFAIFIAMAATLVGMRPALAAESRNQLDQESRAALTALLNQTPAAKALEAKAKGVLVFPDIVKAGFIIGAQGGDGILLKHNKTVGYYNSAGVSVGLQAGGQTFGYALFFMTDHEMKAFEHSEGWEIGVGPNIVVVDAGAAKDMTTLTGKADVYAFIFDQKGLMAGVGLKGSKITKLSP